MKKAPLVMMMAGGTGGHIFPALAVAQSLKTKGYRVCWLGTSVGLESKIVPEARIALYRLAVRGLRGKSWRAVAEGLVRFAVAVAQAMWIMLRLRPTLVIGMGGYVAAPGGIAAFVMRRPLFIHEQNSVAGSTNRILRPLARRIFAAFPGAFTTAAKVEVIGNPVRPSIVEVGRQRSAYTAERDLHVLVLGGSQGARAINQVLPQAVSEFEALNSGVALEIWHQVGSNNLADVSAHYAHLGLSHVRVAAFIDDMSEAYRWADVVIARAGALTCSELLAAACPAALVPLPNAIDDHQYKNASVLAEAGAVVLLEQTLLTTESLVDLWTKWSHNPSLLEDMSTAARALAQNEATQRIVDAAEELIHA